MRDPSYLIVISVIVVLVIDYFFLGGYVLHGTGKAIVNMADRIGGWFG